MTKQLYYVRDISTNVGNSVLWWSHNNRGYSVDLRRAKIFTHEEADRLCRDRPDTFKKYPIDGVLPIVQHHVDYQDLDVGAKLPHTLDMRGTMR